MLVHCNMKIKPIVVWFLHPNRDYTNRRLEIAHCPKCDKLIVKYLRENIMTSNLVIDNYSSFKAEQLMETLKNEREYTSLDLVKNNGLYGFRYGENKEIKKGNKKVIIQKAVDFYGNKELIHKS